MSPRLLCRACQRPMIAPGDRRPRGGQPVVLRSGRGMCGVCGPQYSDAQLARLELARLFKRPPSTNWMRRAACARPGVDPDIFHPHDFDEETRKQARRICAHCPVTRECLDDALATRDAHGVRAGLTGPERALIVKQQQELETAR